MEDLFNANKKNKQQRSSLVFFRAKTDHRALRATWQHKSHTCRNHTDHNEKRRLPPRCHTCHSELVATTHKVWASCFPPALVAPGSSQDHAPDCKTQSHLFPFSPARELLAWHCSHPATRAPPCTSFSVQICNPRFQHRCCSLLVAFSWSRDGIGQIRAKVEQLAGQLARCRLQKCFPSPPPPGMVRNEAVAEERGSRALSGSSVHIVTSSKLSKSCRMCLGMFFDKQRSNSV